MFQFLNTESITPRAGDIVLLGQSSHRWKSSNKADFAMIEHYNTTDHTADLIIANFDRNRAGGAAITLENRDTVKKILALIRFESAAFIPSSSTNASTLTNNESQQIIIGIKNHSKEILKTVIAKNWFQSSNIEGTVNTLYQDKS